MLYPPGKWNVHAATLNNDTRTNNICEGWNNEFRNLMGNKHPLVWKVIQRSQQDWNSVEVIIQHDAMRQPLAKSQRKKYVDIQTCFRNLYLDYNSRRKDIGQFLNGVAQNVRILGQI
ncbi:uncharacterized protein LOC143033199 [Oratosquilla oratoria]|uniref:uncharacterized protein LOC143033199 n=1 Tax=Oratosquilla oratoria TaxID=337810 RepID=UPI003F768591